MSKKLENMFENDFEDTCAEIFPLMVMWVLATVSSVCSQGGARTPIGMSGNL